MRRVSPIVQCSVDIPKYLCQKGDKDRETYNLKGSELE